MRSEVYAAGEMEDEGSTAHTEAISYTTILHRIPIGRSLERSRMTCIFYSILSGPALSRPLFRDKLKRDMADLTTSSSPSSGRFYHQRIFTTENSAASAEFEEAMLLGINEVDSLLPYFRPFFLPLLSPPVFESYSKTIYIP
jgi:hypothetical protein